MKTNERIVVVGLGEVGKPLLRLVSEHYSAVGVDIAPLSSDAGVADVLHICYPFQIPDFIGETVRYMDLFKAKLTVINSTVAVGTTRSIAQLSSGRIAYSPVRGKHMRMFEELKRYTKFIGGVDQNSGEAAARHFESMGLKTKNLSTPEAAELAKLTETTFFGLMIAWAQEVERDAYKVGAKYDEVVSFYEEIGFFPPVKYFPGVIGGHCVMPNIELLQRLQHSEILQAIKSSNSKKMEEKSGILQQ
jgi:UDP-N-acetyl-D-mannosaminuronate dehydrogenase